MSIDEETIDAHYMSEQHKVCVYSTKGGRIIFDDSKSDTEIRKTVSQWWHVGERGRAAIERALETRRSICLS